MKPELIASPKPIEKNKYHKLQKRNEEELQADLAAANSRARQVVIESEPEGKLHKGEKEDIPIAEVDDKELNKLRLLFDDLEKLVDFEEGER